MPSHTNVRPSLAAAALAASVLGAGCLGEPVDDIGRASFSATVDELVNTGCSTSVVLELSRQIADEVRCMAPGILDSFAEGNGIVFAGSAVLPYLHPNAKADLLDAVASSSTELRINSGYRTVVQQYLLYRWYLDGRCNIAAAATPGRSNHESGRALDIGNYGQWTDTLPTYRWAQTVPGDWVHFDHVESPDMRGMDVLGFQRLWNRNHPEDVIAEDGLYGPETEARLRLSPAEGFPVGACPADGYAGDLLALDAPEALAPGELGTVRVEVMNSGDAPWQPGSTYLGTAAPQDRESELYVADSWFSPSRPATVAEATPPGDLGVFEFDVRAPEVEGGTVVSESFSLVEETVTWFGPEEIALEIVVGDGEPSEPSEPTMPKRDDLSGGCAAAGSGGLPAAALLFFLPALVGRIGSVFRPRRR